MSDYEPEYVVMINIPYKSKEIYYEDIQNTPADVRGAFLTDEDKKEKIDFEVRKLLLPFR